MYLGQNYIESTVDKKPEYYGCWSSSDRIILYTFLCCVISAVCIKLCKTIALRLFKFKFVGFYCSWRVMRAFYFISLSRNPSDIYFKTIQFIKAKQ